MAEDAVGADYGPSVIALRFDPMTWQKPVRSEPNGGNCVEVNFGSAKVGLRDSKLSESPVFVYTAGEWRSFIDAIKAGRLDPIR